MSSDKRFSFLAPPTQRQDRGWSSGTVESQPRPRLLAWQLTSGPFSTHGNSQANPFGPNLWTRSPVLEAWVDLSRSGDRTADSSTALGERLRAWLPSMFEPTAGDDRSRWAGELSGGDAELAHLWAVQRWNSKGWPAPTPASVKFRRWPSPARTRSSSASKKSRWDASVCERRASCWQRPVRTGLLICGRRSSDYRS